MLIENAEGNLRYHVKREFTKKTRIVNEWCHNALCIETVNDL